MKIMKLVKISQINMNPENLSEDEIILRIRNNIDFLKQVKSPSERVQIEAVKIYPYSIGWIENSCIEAQMEAIRRDHRTIIGIKNPSVELQMELVKISPNYIPWIKNPCIEVDLYMVRKNGTYIRFIRDPSKEIQIEAIKQTTKAFWYIENPCKEAILELNKQILNNMKVKLQ